MSDKDNRDLDSGYHIGHEYCIASEIEGKDECHSSDALDIREHDSEDGGVWYDAYCWSCKQYYSQQDLSKSSLAPKLGLGEGVVVERKVFERKPKQEPLSKEKVKSLIKDIGYSSNNYRGIRDEINQFFGHLTQTDDKGKVIARYYPETRNSDPWPTGYKIRFDPKSWNKLGQTGMQSELSGQCKFRSGGRYLLCVGGEEDKSAAYQMLLDSQKDRNQGEYDGIAVVSPTCGESNAPKQVAANYDFFDMFDIIVIGMDNDEVGRKAAKAIAEVLPKHKVRIALWSGKDPNSMLLEGKEKQFVRNFYSAKEYIATDIKHSSDALEEAIDFLKAEKIPLPPHLHRLQTNMRGGIRTTGAIINLIGDTSIGKSLFTDTLVYYWFWNSPLVPTIVSLERTTGELTVDLLSMHLKRNFTFMEDYNKAIEIIESPENKHLVEDLLINEFGEPRYHVLDERSGNPDALKSCVERSGIQYKSKLIIFDPLSDFLRSLGTEAQEDFMMWQKQKKKEGFVFINVLHTRKPTPDKDGKVRKVTEYDAIGSGSFVQSADVNIVINRDKMAEDPVERNTTVVDAPKVRGGVTGHACDLYFDQHTRLLYDKEDYFNGTPSEYKDNLPEYEEGDGINDVNNLF